MYGCPPFPGCWKEGENCLAVTLAMRLSSWAFWAAATAASALPCAWAVLKDRIVKIITLIYIAYYKFSEQIFCCWAFWQQQLNEANIWKKRIWGQLNHSKSKRERNGLGNVFKKIRNVFPLKIYWNMKLKYSNWLSPLSPDCNHCSLHYILVYMVHENPLKSVNKILKSILKHTSLT